MKRVVVDCSSTSENNFKNQLFNFQGLNTMAAMQNNDTILNFQNHTVMQESTGATAHSSNNQHSSQQRNHQGHSNIPQSPFGSMLWEAAPTGGRATIPLPRETNKLIIDVSTGSDHSGSQHDLRNFTPSSACNSEEICFGQFQSANVLEDNAWSGHTSMATAKTNRRKKPCTSKIAIKFDTTMRLPPRNMFGASPGSGSSSTESSPALEDSRRNPAIEDINQSTTDSANTDKESDEKYDSDFESDSEDEQKSQKKDRESIKKNSREFMKKLQEQERENLAVKIQAREQRLKARTNSKEGSWLNALLSRRTEEKAAEAENKEVQLMLKDIEVVEPEKNWEDWVLCE